jgi:hypothetical protein
MKRGVVCCALLLVSFGAAGAARLPEWAETIADSTSPPPEGLSDIPSVTLADETLYAFDDEGALRIRRRVAVQALRSTASEVGIGAFSFGDDAKILRSRAWHVPPAGRRAKKVRSSAAWDVTLQDAFLTDSQLRMIRVADIDKGSLVFFEFEIVDRPEMLDIQHLFIGGGRVQAARVLVEAPPDWSVHHAWLRVEGPDPRIEDGARIWELRELETIEDVAFGVDAVDRAPLLVVGLRPPDDIEVAAATPEDWAELAIWYEQLIAGTDAPSAEIEAKADALCAEEDGSALEILRLATYVRDAVRYVAVSLGIGSIKPRPAHDTASRLWGDCKDKGTLLRSLLRTSDVESYPILINLSRHDTVAESVPGLRAFNHFVVGVNVTDADLPVRFDAATMEVDAIGRILVIDSTDEFTAVGSLSAALAGKTGLLVAGDRSRLITLPLGGPATHRVDRRLDIDLSADGEAAASLTTRLSGEFASDARRCYASSSRDFQGTVERRLREHWADVTVEALEIEPEDELGRFVWTAAFRLPPHPGQPSSSIAIFPGAMNELPRLSLRRRQADVRIGFGRHLRYETTIHGLPGDRSIEGDPHEERGEGWAVLTRTERDGTTVRASWEVEVDRRDFEVGAFDELKRLLSAARKSSQATLEPGEGEPAASIH